MPFPDSQFSRKRIKGRNASKPSPAILISPNHTGTQPAGEETAFQPSAPCSSVSTCRPEQGNISSPVPASLSPEVSRMSVCRATRRARIVAAVTLTTVFLAPGFVWSWGSTAHRASARMAEDRLSPAALAAIHDLLGPGITLADVATWADEQRQVPRSGPWHYVNVPISESRYDPKFCQRGGCVVSKIEDFRRVLLDSGAGKMEKQQALKFLIHFIADLHQPLQVGDTGSRGGNLIQVRFFNVGSNLYRV